MPVRYTSDLAEHHAVRQAAGLFDISHMAEFTVTGAAAARVLDFALAGRISTMKIGKAKYSLLLDDNGGVIDDVIVYRRGDEDFLVISNAGNRALVAAEFGRLLGDGRHRDVSDDVALIAVQAPGAIVEEPPASRMSRRALAASATTHGRGNLRESLFIARTGYTGEDGFELWCRTRSPPSGMRCSPRARRTASCRRASPRATRCASGGDAAPRPRAVDRILPAQAGLGRVVAMDKDDFVGKDALAAASTDLPVLVGLAAEGRRAGRAGYAVLEPRAHPSARSRAAC
jgi:aminomethyltransferase